MAARSAEYCSVEDLFTFYRSDQYLSPQDLTVDGYFVLNLHVNASTLNDDLFGHNWSEHVLRQAVRPVS